MIFALNGEEPDLINALIWGFRLRYYREARSECISRYIGVVYEDYDHRRLISTSIYIVNRSDADMLARVKFLVSEIPDCTAYTIF